MYPILSKIAHEIFTKITYLCANSFITVSRNPAPFFSLPMLQCAAKKKEFKIWSKKI